MKRREFITLLGGAAVAWPLAARAQQPAMPVIGFLNSTSPDRVGTSAAAFRQGLSEIGYVEHRNVGIEWRWAEGRYERLPALAADLVRRQVAVIVSPAGLNAFAAKAATTRQFRSCSPSALTRSRWVGRQPRSAGWQRHRCAHVSARWKASGLGLLRELVPTAALIGVLLNPTMFPAERQLKDVQEAARAIGQQIQIVHASSEPATCHGVQTVVRDCAPEPLRGADPFFNSRRDVIVDVGGTPRRSRDI